jgi:RNase P protein component
VARNQLKRRLRELVRTTLLPGAPLVDLVIRARREAYDASFESLGTQIARVVSQVGALAASGALPTARPKTKPAVRQAPEQPRPETGEREGSGTDE